MTMMETAMGQTRLFAARSRAMQRPFAAAKPAQQPARRPAAPLIAACLRAPQLASVGRISGVAAPGSRRNMLLGRNCPDGSAHVTAAPTWLPAARLRLPTRLPPCPLQAPPASAAARGQGCHALGSRYRPARSCLRGAAGAARRRRRSHPLGGAALPPPLPAVHPSRWLHATPLMLRCGTLCCAVQQLQVAARARDPDELDAEDEEELNKGPPSLLWRVFAAFCYMVGGGVLWVVHCGWWVVLCGWYSGGGGWCIVGDM